MKAALATVALAAAATCASAAELKVNLPIQVQWGRALLPAGNYTVSISQDSNLRRVSGNGKNVSVLVATSEYGHVSSSHVRIVDVNGTPVINELTSLDFDKTYRFLVPSASAVHGSVRRTVAFNVGDQQSKH
jgi:hypothetical protein